MRKWIAVAGLAALGVFLAASPAGGAMVRVGTLVLTADGSFEPRALPRNQRVPIDFQGHADIRETDGSVPPPLQHVKVEFDRDGHVTTEGLPTCAPQRLEGTTPSQAQSRCRNAIVGTGHVGAAVAVPGLKRVELRSPLTLFNGPKQNGNPTVIAHAWALFPLPETYVVVAPLERRRGTFGYRSSFDIPPIAGGYGSLTHADLDLGRRFRVGGAERSYVSARCSDGILQTQGYFSFAGGVVIYGSVFKACRPL
jgi:hypothetical protein